MNLSSAMLKAKAKRALLGKYGLSVAVIGVFYVIVMGSVMAIEIPFLGMLAISGGNTLILACAVILFTALIFVMMILETLLSVGLLRFFYNICTENEFRVSDLLFPFKNYPLKFMGLSLLLAMISIAIFLPVFILNVAAILIPEMWWLLLISIPAYIVCLALLIVLMLRYSLAFLLLMEDPDKRVFDCLRESAYLMKGNKGRLCYLYLSFIGIAILGQMSLGVGYLWIIPYMSCTFIYFYLDVKRGKIEMKPPNDL